MSITDASIADLTSIPMQMSVAAIMSADDAWKAMEAAALSNTWDGEMRAVSKYAENLLQLDNGRKIPPSGTAVGRKLSVCRKMSSIE